MKHLKIKRSESIKTWIQKILHYCQAHPNSITLYILKDHHRSVKDCHDPKELPVYIRKQWIEMLNDIFDMPLWNDDININIIDKWSDIMYPENFNAHKECLICLQAKKECQFKSCKIKSSGFTF